MFEVRWHGRGGQGSFTGAKLLGAAAVLYDGLYAQAFPSFGPERRGAPVLGFNRIDRNPVYDHSEISRCDRIVFLDDSLFHERYLGDLKPNACILINTTQQLDAVDSRIHCLDATGLALGVLGKPIANTAMLGFLLAFSEDHISLSACEQAIANDMKPGLAAGNSELLRQAYRAGLALRDGGKTRSASSVDKQDATMHKAGGTGPAAGASQQTVGDQADRSDAQDKEVHL